MAAEHGSANARALLYEGPECPRALRYLLEWASALHGRSGYTMSGSAPLTWATLDAWSRLTGNIPDQEDIDALFTLDAVMLRPAAGSGAAKGTH